MVDAAHYDQLLRRVFAGRKVVVASDTLVGAAGLARTLTALGAERPFLLAGSTGTGDLPTEDEAEQHVLDTHGGSVMESIRAFEDALANPTRAVLDSLDRYDPQREAIVVGTLFTHEGEVCARRSFGGRRLEWERLEDKMVVDELLDAAGIARAPSEIVPAQPSVLAGAARALDHGTGTAWAGDAREGWWGGAEYFRWVRTREDADEASAFFAERCDRVRVMPFLNGIPCSIHGMVFDDDVIAFRPVEMLTLRRPGSSKLHYTGLATYWDPDEADRGQMRTAACALGALLRERVAYRGAFTLDGVISADGFRPTEMNPRAGAGLGPQSGAAGINLGMISRLVCEQPDLDFRPRELEALVVERADAQRAGSAYTVHEQKRTASEYRPIVEDGGGYRFARDGEVADGRIALGPSGVGGFVAFQPDPSKIPKGPSFAPRAVRALALADEAFDIGLGPLEPALPVR